MIILPLILIYWLAKSELNSLYFVFSLLIYYIYRAFLDYYRLKLMGFKVKLYKFFLPFGRKNLYRTLYLK